MSPWVHEPGHPEPWIIAMSEPPTVYRAYDYGLWGIEAMFSDFTSRGFGLEDSRLRRPADPGHGPVLGGLDRQVGCGPWRHAR
jgi:hypothetical protein